MKPIAIEDQFEELEERVKLLSEALSEAHQKNLKLKNALTSISEVLLKNGIDIQESVIPYLK